MFEKPIKLICETAPIDCFLNLVILNKQKQMLYFLHYDDQLQKRLVMTIIYSFYCLHTVLKHRNFYKYGIMN